MYTQLRFHFLTQLVLVTEWGQIVSKPIFQRSLRKHQNFLLVPPIKFWLIIRSSDPRTITYKASWVIPSVWSSSSQLNKNLNVYCYKLLQLWSYIYIRIVNSGEHWSSQCWYRDKLLWTSDMGREKERERGGETDRQMRQRRKRQKGGERQRNRTLKENFTAGRTLN